MKSLSHLFVLILIFWLGLFVGWRERSIGVGCGVAVVRYLTPEESTSKIVVIPGGGGGMISSVGAEGESRPFPGRKTGGAGGVGGGP